MMIHQIISLPPPFHRIELVMERSIIPNSDLEMQPMHNLYVIDPAFPDRKEPLMSLWESDCDGCTADAEAAK